MGQAWDSFVRGFVSEFRQLHGIVAEGLVSGFPTPVSRPVRKERSASEDDAAGRRGDAESRPKPQGRSVSHKPGGEGTAREPLADDVKHDLRTLARFIGVYCKHKHTDVPKQPSLMKAFDLVSITGRTTSLCSSCHKLLTHAVVKRTHCPLNPKPMCRHCPQHCYQADYRERIREVMRFSGRKLLLSGRLDYLFHLLF